MVKSRHRASRTGAQQVTLRKPLARALRSGHPWVFRDALQPFEAEPGRMVRVVDKDGRFVAVGLAEQGPIGVRVFSLQEEPVDEALWSRRILGALAMRARVIGDDTDTDAYRLLHGEGDRLPGVVCDRYGAFAVLRLDGEAALSLRATWVRLFETHLPALGIEGLLVRTGSGPDKEVELAWGTAPPRELIVRERGMRLRANLYEGQKTGLFLDHRLSRARVRQLAQGARVLNLYGYTGGFSIAAGLGGARSVTTVDIARPALQLAEASWSDNDLPAAVHQTICGDALEVLSKAADGGDTWDLVIADPPNFAPRQSARDQALAAYEALHGLVLRVLAPGGLYLAASCSSHVTHDDFAATLVQAGLRARKVIQVLEQGGSPADHPKLLGFPEGNYLKVVLLRAL
jgi:23S rRNA (cytosine1962-C5)-methyltransferase